MRTIEWSPNWITNKEPHCLNKQIYKRVRYLSIIGINNFIEMRLPSEIDTK